MHMFEHVCSYMLNHLEFFSGSSWDQQGHHGEVSPNLAQGSEKLGRLCSKNSRRLEAHVQQELGSLCTCASHIQVFSLVPRLLVKKNKTNKQTNKQTNKKNRSLGTRPCITVKLRRLIPSPPPRLSSLVLRITRYSYCK